MVENSCRGKKPCHRKETNVKQSISSWRTCGRTAAIAVGERQTARSWRGNTPGFPARWVPGRTRCSGEGRGRRWGQGHGRRGQGQGQTKVAEPSEERREVVRCRLSAYQNLSDARRRNLPWASNGCSTVWCWLNWSWLQVGDSHCRLAATDAEVRRHRCWVDVADSVTAITSNQVSQSSPYQSPKSSSAKTKNSALTFLECINGNLLAWAADGSGSLRDLDPYLWEISTIKICCSLSHVSLTACRLSHSSSSSSQITWHCK